MLYEYIDPALFYKYVKTQPNARVTSSFFQLLCGRKYAHQSGYICHIP